MIRMAIIFILLLAGRELVQGQGFVKTSELFPPQKPGSGGGELIINQSPAVDTLISRYIIGNMRLRGGIDGFRIQIYRSSTRNARDEANKVRAEFMIEYPDIPSYIEYAEPGYFLVRVGDFRTRMDGTKYLYMVRKRFPNAYPVPCIINDPGKKNN